jgi:quinol monooxygenase YgiN
MEIDDCSSIGAAAKIRGSIESMPPPDISGVPRHAVAGRSAWRSTRPFAARNPSRLLRFPEPAVTRRFWYAVCSTAVVIRLTLLITAARGEAWRLIDALCSLMVPTRRERGCVSCQLELSSESSDPMRISYSEVWSSEEELREQVRSERFLRLLELMENALEPPQLRFELPGGERGLDYVEEVRAGLTRRFRLHPGFGNGRES